jgi:hypothetical protein
VSSLPNFTRLPAPRIRHRSRDFAVVMAQTSQAPNVIGIFPHIQ